MDISFLGNNPEKLIAIYCNKQNPDRFLVGCLVAYDLHCLVLSLLTSNAHTDGLCLCASPDVFRIEFDSQYLLKLEEKRSQSTHPLWTGDPWAVFWNYAKEMKLIVQIKRRSSKQALYGFCVEYNENAIVVQRIRCNGTVQREYSLRRGDILLAVCESTTEKSVQKKYLRRVQNA